MLDKCTARIRRRCESKWWAYRLEPGAARPFLLVYVMRYWLFCWFLTLIRHIGKLEKMYDDWTADRQTSLRLNWELSKCKIKPKVTIINIKTEHILTYVWCHTILRLWLAGWISLDGLREHSRDHSGHQLLLHPKREMTTQCFSAIMLWWW